MIKRHYSAELAMRVWKWKCARLNNVSNDIEFKHYDLYFVQLFTSIVGFNIAYYTEGRSTLRWRSPPNMEKKEFLNCDWSKVQLLTYGCLD